MIRFDVEHLPAGKCRYTANGHENADPRAVARKLVETDTPDQPVEAGRPGRVDWTAGSLHALAASTLTEGDKGFRVGIYEPYPVREMHPALEHAISRCREARKDGVSRLAATPALESVDDALCVAGIGLVECGGNEPRD